MRSVLATRYVVPLREGGSLPALVEADDLGTYVLKFRGAGQGPRALIAELVGGEIGRALGLPVPELVFVELVSSFGRSEPDEEIQALIQASIGLNIGLDYLPGSLPYDPAASSISEDVASRVVWFDAFITNVDRTVRNTNLLLWHHTLYLIDHGAALYFHHTWENYLAHALTPFSYSKNHVLLPRASRLPTVDEQFRTLLTPSILEKIVHSIPDVWLADIPELLTPALCREAYYTYLSRRLQASSLFVKEAVNARAQLV